LPALEAIQLKSSLRLPEGPLKEVFSCKVWFSFRIKKQGVVRILVIEDERKLATAIKEGLESEGYVVTLSHTGEDAFFRLCREPFEMALLDVMLPGRDGFEILAPLREQGIKLPVLLLTAKDTLEDRVRGLDTGGDDYLVKPFAFPELLARVRALLRRGGSRPKTRSRIADLEIDITARAVKRRRWNRFDCARIRNPRVSLCSSEPSGLTGNVGSRYLERYSSPDSTR
jgi:CheY-like chemotaxis protein